MTSSNHSLKESTALSMGKIIESIRQSRDFHISELLKDAVLLSFIEGHFETITLSAVKLEFLKRDLKELKKSSLDLAHYSSLIKRMKELNSGIPDDTHPLFLEELKVIFRKYGVD